MSLNDKRIVVTRAAHQAGDLADLLRAAGAEPLLYPCIAIEPPLDTAELDAALRQAASGKFDWLVLTSTNTVEALRQRIAELSITLRGVPTAAVGPATAAAAQSVLGVDVQTLPDEYVAEALAEALHPTPGMRILLPQANIARDTLRELLVQAGTQVTVITSYQTVIGRGGVHLPALLAAHQVDAITFTSSSTVTHCLQRLQAEGGDPAHLADVICACIGPKTAQTAQAAHLDRITVPNVYTLEGIVESLVTVFATEE